MESSAFTSAATYVLFLFFGIGSWVTVTSLFTELPLLVVALPEGWHLASVLALAVQLGNVGPLAYVLLRRHLQRRGASAAMQTRLAAVTTYVVLGTGALAMASLAKVWSVTVHFGGKERSVPLVLLTAVAATADCTSSVLFWSFAGNFRTLHMSALAAGAGLNGVVASGLAWVQDAAGEHPRFGTSVYFALVAVVMCLSFGAFHALRKARCAQVERRVQQDVLEVPLASEGVGIAAEEGSAAAGALEEGARSGGNGASTSPPPRAADGSVKACLAGLCARSSGRSGSSCWESKWLLLLQAWINVLQNGVSVSCLALAAKPYGRVVYQAAQTVSLVIDPAISALGYHLPVSAMGLLPLTIAMTVLHGYILVLSLDCVTPPLLTEGFPDPQSKHWGPGGALLVVVVAVGRSLTAYTKMRANILLKERAGQDAESRLISSGVAMQCGAFSGSVVLYLLINYTRLFRSAY